MKRQFLLFALSIIFILLFSATVYAATASSCQTTLNIVLNPPIVVTAYMVGKYVGSTGCGNNLYIPFTQTISNAGYEVSAFSRTSATDFGNPNAANVGTIASGGTLQLNAGWYAFVTALGQFTITYATQQCTPNSACCDSSGFWKAAGTVDGVNCCKGSGIDANKPACKALGDVNGADCASVAYTTTCSLTGWSSCSGGTLVTCSSGNACILNLCSSKKCFYSNSGAYSWADSYPSSETACADSKDNDCDTKIDSQDTDCSFCGNSVIDVGEKCDGTILAGATCASVMGSGWTGTLACANCQFNTAGCIAPPAPPTQPTEWQPIDLKYSPNRHFYGFCSNETKCFNGATDCISGDINLCSCLNNTQFTGDYYCDSGNWTTRTRLVASQLLAFADAGNYNYSLFCGNLTETGLLEKLGGISANNFDKICVLKYGNNLGFGAALKAGVAPATAIPDATGCLTSENTFQRCGATSQFWFNPAINSIIYLQSGTLASAPAIPLTTQFISFIKTPFTVLKDFLFVKETQTAYPEPELTQKLLNNTQLFDKLYIAKTGTKSFFAVLQQNQYEGTTLYDYLIINYTGISTVPVCDLLTGMNEGCYLEGNFFVVKTYYDPQRGGKVNLYPYWLDLTSKLRPT